MTFSNVRAQFDALTGDEEMSTESAIERIREQIREDACVFDVVGLLEQLELIEQCEQGVLVLPEQDIVYYEMSLPEAIDVVVDLEDPDRDAELVETVLGDADGFEGGAVLYTQDMADSGWELSDADHARALEALGDSVVEEALDTSIVSVSEELDIRLRGQRRKAWRRFFLDREPTRRELTVIKTAVAHDENGYVEHVEIDVRGVAVVVSTCLDLVDDEVVYTSAWQGIVSGIARTANFIAARIPQVDVAIGKVVIGTVVKHLQSGVLVKNEHGQKGLISASTIQGVGSAANALSFLRSHCPVGREVRVEIVARRDKGDFVLKLASRK